MEGLLQYFKKRLAPVPPELARDALGCVPLRVEDVMNDASPFQFRHKSLCEFIAARWFFGELHIPPRHLHGDVPVPPPLLRRLTQRVPEMRDLMDGRIASYDE
eukprot:gene34474-24358_t